MTAKGFGQHIAFLLVLAAGFLVYLCNFNLTITDDEGSFLYYSWRVAQGDVMYRDFSAIHLPPIPLFVGLLFKLFGPSAWLAKIATVIVSVGNVGLVYLLGKEMAGRMAGILSAVLYLFSPDPIHLSSALLLEPWFLSALLFGLLCQAKAERTKRLRLYFLAGLGYGAAIHMKLLALIPVGGVLLWFVLSLRNGSEERLLHGKRLLAALGLLCLGIVTTIGVALVYRLTIGEFYHSPSVTKLSFWGVWQVVGGYFEHNLYATVLLVLALPLAIKAYRRRDGWLLIASYCSSVLLFFLWPRSPFFSHFLTFLIPGLSLLAGGTLCVGVRKLRHGALRGAAVLAICICAGAGFLGSQEWIPSWRDTQEVELKGARAFFFPDEAEGAILRTIFQLPSVIQFVTEHTTQEDYILADFGYVPFFARRRNVPLPYDLHNATVNRIPLEDYERAIEQYRPEMVVISRTLAAFGHLTAYRRLGELTRSLERDYERCGGESMDRFILYIRKR